MSTVYVCPERDIECGHTPSSWCDKCPQHLPADPDEEPSWAFKNPQAPGDLKIGDYVFASRWGDCDPGDPWGVGYVSYLADNWILLEGGHKRWPRASRITEEQGARIIAEYPPKEGGRGIPYEFIHSIFAPKKGCDKCGIEGIHACPGAPVPKPSEESIQNLNEVLSSYAPIPITMRPLTEEELISIKEQYQASKTLTVGTHLDPRGIAANQFPLDLFSTKIDLRPKAEAFDAIKAALDDPNQDGVLAKIRRIVAAIKDPR